MQDGPLEGGRGSLLGLHEIVNLTKFQFWSRFQLLLGIGNGRGQYEFHSFQFQFSDGHYPVGDCKPFVDGWKRLRLVGKFQICFVVSGIEVSLPIMHICFESSISGLTMFWLFLL